MEGDSACLFVEGKNDDDRRGGRCIGEGAGVVNRTIFDSRER